MPWQPPSLTLRWGAYTKPDEQAQLYMVQAVQGALGGAGGKQIITKRIGLEKLKQAGVFEIENVSAVLDAVDEESQKALADAQSAMGDLPGQPQKPAAPAAPAKPMMPTQSKP